MEEKRKQKQRLLTGAAAGLLVLGGLLYYLVRRSYELPYLLAIMALAAAAVVIHCRRSLAWPRGGRGYVLHLLGTDGGGKERIVQLDHIRAMALCGVIITHAVQIDLETAGGAPDPAANILWVVTMAANAVYVMLSGALLYRWKDEKLPAFYLRRFAEVVIPLAVYYMFYLAVNYRLGRGWNWVSIRSVPGWLLTNRMKEAPHLWLVYVILSVYLTVPFFRYALKGFPYERLTRILSALFAFSVLTMIVDALIPYADLAVRIPFTGWLLVSLYGYWVTLPESRRYDGVLTGLGALALLATGILAGSCPPREILDTWCLNDAFLPVLLCLGLFALVFRLSSGRKGGSRRPLFLQRGPVLRSLGRYGYGILLIHWYTLHFIVIDRFHIHASMWGWLGVIPSLILTLAGSWIICLVIDNLLVLPLKTVWTYLCRAGGLT